jgi:hypothetical protein
MPQVADEDFSNIDDFEVELAARDKQESIAKTLIPIKKAAFTNAATSPGLTQLENGRYPCKHSCKDKTRWALLYDFDDRC